MAFADLTNDFVFRRIFATHPDILRGLLNDLLDRQGEQAIDALEYLPSEQLPLVAGAKLSIQGDRIKSWIISITCEQAIKSQLREARPHDLFGSNESTEKQA